MTYLLQLYTTSITDDDDDDDVSIRGLTILASYDACFAIRLYDANSVITKMAHMNDANKIRDIPKLPSLHLDPPFSLV